MHKDMSVSLPGRIMSAFSDPSSDSNPTDLSMVVDYSVSSVVSQGDHCSL